MTDDTDYDIDEMLTPADGEYIATRPEDASNFGKKRHILEPTFEKDDDGEKVWTGTYNSRCNRKTAPRDIRGVSLHIVDAYNLVLNSTEVCPTCAKRAGLEAQIDWNDVREAARLATDDSFTPDEDERIKVRTSHTVTYDFPNSVKFDLIEILREQAAQADDGPGLSGLAGDVDDDVIDVPASEEAD